MTEFRVRLQEWIWDEKLAQLTPVGRLTYQQVGVGFEDAWGWGTGSITSFISDAWPREAERAFDGDAAAIAHMREAKEQLALAVELGLLVCDRLGNGQVALGYARWDRHTGERLDKRGTPKHPIGPNLAAARDWSRMNPSTITSDAFAAYLERCGPDVAAVVRGAHGDLAAKTRNTFLASSENTEHVPGSAEEHGTRSGLQAKTRTLVEVGKDVDVEREYVGKRAECVADDGGGTAGTETPRSATYLPEVSLSEEHEKLRDPVQNVVATLAAGVRALRGAPKQQEADKIAGALAASRVPGHQNGRAGEVAEAVARAVVEKGLKCRSWAQAAALIEQEVEMANDRLARAAPGQRARSGPQVSDAEAAAVVSQAEERYRQAQAELVEARGSPAEQDAQDRHQDAFEALQEALRFGGRVPHGRG